MFTKAIVRVPAENFAEGLTTVDLGRPDFARVLEQHRSYCAALVECGLAVIELAPDARFPDSTFVEDTAVLTAQRAVITRPGAESRAGEIDAIRDALASHYSTTQSIVAPGTVDGGDICEADGHVFIGLSERTNAEGARQLAELLARFGFSSSTVDIRGRTDILHLKSGIAYLGDRRLVLIDALADDPAFDGYGKVRVAREEEYAANCVRVNGHVLIAAGFAKFEASLQALGYKTIALKMSEFRKMDGGLSCLSLRL